MKQPVIFDFDGTLADTFEILLDESAAFIQRDSKFTAAEADYLRTLAAQDVLAEMNITPEQVPTYLRSVQAGLMARVNEIALFDGLQNVLKQLAKEHPLYIVSTNGNHVIDAILRAHSVRDQFAEIISTGMHKAEALNQFCVDHAYKVDDCVYVGDEIRDITACKKVGMQCVAVTWGYNTEQSLREANPDAVVSTPQELVTLLKQM